MSDFSDADFDDEIEEIPDVNTPDAHRIGQTFAVDEASAGRRLDQFLTAHLHDVSRARVQHLIEQEHVTITGHDGNPRTMKASGKLRAGEAVVVTGEAAAPVLRAMAEAIPLDIVYEDAFLAVINKPAGMMVHAGSGATESARNRGHSGQRSAASYGKLIRGRRTVTARHRASAGQTDQRPDCRCKGRPHARPAGRDVRAPPGT